MKRNSKGIKGWGFRQFISILSSIMIVLNTISPAFPVFAETINNPTDETEIGASAETTDSDTADLGDNADNTSTPDSQEGGDSSDEKVLDEGTQSGEGDDADKSDSKINSDNADGDQTSDTETNTSEGSTEKETNTDQSGQNGDDNDTQPSEQEVQPSIEEIVNDMNLQNESRVIIVAKKLGIDWDTECEDYAKLAGITEGYERSTQQNEIIRLYLIENAVEIYKANQEKKEDNKQIEKEEGNITENVESTENTEQTTENAEVDDGLNKQIITGTGEFDGVIVRVVAPERTFPEGTEVRIKTIEEMDFEVVYDILQKETELDNQVREKENAQIEKKVSFDISFVDPKDETKDLEPAEGKQVSVVFEYKDNDAFLNAKEDETREIAVYHMEETTSDSVEAESKDALSLNQVKGEVKEDLTGDYKDVINEIDKNQSVGVVVGADEFSTYILVIKVNTGTTPEFYQISFDEKGGFLSNTGNYSWDDDLGMYKRVLNTGNLEIELPDIKRDGHTFLGWFSDGNRVGGIGDSMTVPVGYTTLEAKWNTGDSVVVIGKQGYTTFTEALAAAHGMINPTITLLTGVEVTSMFDVTKTMTIDLNGHKLSKDDGNSIVQVTEDAKLTIDGTKENSEIYGRINAGKASNNNGKIELNGGYYHCASGNTVLHVNGTCETSDVTIKNATIISPDDNGIQLNGQGTHVIINSKISGKTAIYVKAKDVTIIGSEIKSTASSHTAYLYNSNGSNPTGDGIVVDSCDYPRGSPKVTLGSGNTFEVSSSINKEVGYYEYNTGSVTWTGGTITATSNDLSLADGFVRKSLDDGTYKVVPIGDYVADINGVLYSTFTGAAEASTGDDVINLLQNAGSYTMKVGQVLKVKKNGKSITVNAPAYYVLSSATANGITTYTVVEASIEYTATNGKVTYSTSLPSAFAGGTYKLLQNVTRTTRMTPGTFASDVTLDLNGYTLTSTATDYAILLSRNGSASSYKTFKIIDSSGSGSGKLVVNSQADAAIQAQGKFNDITIGTGVTIDGGCIAILSENQTLDVYGKIDGGDDFAIAENGSHTKNSTINIYDGANITSNGIAIYLPGSGVRNIEGGTIEGATAVYIKSGKLNIKGGALVGNGVKADYQYNGNGANPTGDGIVVDSCNYPEGKPTVIISGNPAFTSTNNNSIGYYKHENSQGYVNLGSVTAISNTIDLNEGYGWEATNTAGEYEVKPIKYTVHFNGSEATAGTMEDQIFTYDKEEALTGNKFTKDGYTFLGWSTVLNSGVVYTGGQPVKNLTGTNNAIVNLYAVWEGNKYIVEYNNNGGVGSDLIDNATYNSLYTFTGNSFVRDGYTFSGWNTKSDGNGTGYLAGSGIIWNFTGSLTLYAIWSPNDYTVKFDAGSGIGEMSGQNFVYDVVQSLNTYSGHLSKTGYSFSGWIDGSGNRYTDEQSVSNLATTGIVNLTAQWKVNQYYIDFEENGGSTVKKITLDYDSDIVRPSDPSYTDYTFSGWYKDSALTQPYTIPTKMPAENTIVYAKWAVNITFNSNGGTAVNTQSVNIGSGAVKPTDPIRTGYIFTGWYDSTLTNKFDFTTPITENTTLYAKWTPETRVLSFAFTGDIPTPTPTLPSSKNLEVGTGIIVPTVEAVSGYTFTWGSYPSKMPSENLTITGTWTAIQYKVIFNTNSGSTISDNVVYYNEKVSKPANPIKANLIFSGWYTDNGTFNNEFDFNSGIVENPTILYARWLAKVSFNSNSGSTVDDQLILENHIATEPATARTGYTFSGWYDSTLTNKFDFTTPITGNTTLYAKWNVETYNITYVLNSGTNNTGNLSTYTVEDAITLLNPTRTGYSFSGWTEGNTIAKGSTGDKTFTAEWTIVPYTITYTLNSGDNAAGNVTGYDVETSTITLGDPTRTGYTFSGWTSTSDNITTPTTGVQIVKGSTGNRDYTANWDVNKYHIAFVDWDSTLLSGADYDYGTISGSIVLPADPQRTGWTFTGWTGIPDSMPANNVTGIAAYTINSYSLKYVVDGKDYRTGTLNYGTGIIVPTNPNKDCNSFAGWSSSVAGLTTTGTMPDSDVTFTANWNYTCSSSSGGGGGSSGGGSSNGGGSNNMQEIVLGGEVETNTGDNGTGIQYTQEMIDSYEWAYEEGITSKDTIEKAKLKEEITRAELAKMMVMFMSGVLQRQPVVTGTANYEDVSKEALGDLADYIQLAYQYQIMGIHSDGTPLKRFNPKAKVTRAEFATVLSRVLFGDKYNQGGKNYYEKHIKALEESGILSNPDPKIKELRGWIILMLCRSQNIKADDNLIKDNVDVNSNTGDIEDSNTEGNTETGSTQQLIEKIVLGLNSLAQSNANTGDAEQELIDAYKWAYGEGITTMDTIEKAKLKDGITRGQLAKMMVMFMSGVLQKQPVVTGAANYEDVSEEKLGDLAGYIQLAYQYQIMGINSKGVPLKKFNPKAKVTRAEFATVLSRVLFGNVYNQGGVNYYEKHIQALEESGILTNTNPNIKELRGWVILMLYRSRDKK